MTGFTIRWRFQELDMSEVWIVPLNPKEMSSPTIPGRNLQFAFGSYWGVDRIRMIDRAPQSPTELTFSGVLLTAAHYTKLLEWTRKLAVVRLVDHLERTFEVIVQKFDPIERLPTKAHAWRVDYTMTVLVLQEVLDGP